MLAQDPLLIPGLQEVVLDALLDLAAAADLQLWQIAHGITTAVALGADHGHRQGQPLQDGGGEGFALATGVDHRQVAAGHQAVALWAEGAMEPHTAAQLLPQPALEAVAVALGTGQARMAFAEVIEAGSANHLQLRLHAQLAQAGGDGGPVLGELVEAFAGHQRPHEADAQLAPLQGRGWRLAGPAGGAADALGAEEVVDVVVPAGDQRIAEVLRLAHRHQFRLEGFGFAGFVPVVGVADPGQQPRATQPQLPGVQGIEAAAGDHGHIPGLLSGSGQVDHRDAMEGGHRWVERPDAELQAGGCGGLILRQGEHQPHGGEAGAAKARIHPVRLLQGLEDLRLLQNKQHPHRGT